ncbi:MAG TPA: dihydrolipoamide acetyltransferase family protein [Candidatus Binatia bacterium]|jgi:pyruvate dehydrogenase E2 component (dihydrolipoamide acetyltransferase)
MATNVIMPALGVAQQTGKLLNWLKTEGQSVTKGEPLMEIETDKATVEIEAPSSGILTHVTAKPGDEVPVGQRIALILAPGETTTAAALVDPHPRPLPEGEGMSGARHFPELKGTHEGHPFPVGEGRGEGRLTTSTLTPPAAPAAQTRYVGERVLASPKARRIAREKGIQLAMLRGSGPEGSVLAEDVLRAVEGNAALAAEAAQNLIPLSPMRRIVGQRMTQSKQSAPHFYLSMDIDMTAVVKFRSESKERGDRSIPSINDFILLACARTLKDFPAMNSTFTEQGIKVHADINIGMAVALEEGLVVPVIRNADQVTLTEVAQKSRELADKAQTKKLFPLDYEGGTFTVSNLGTLGVDSFIAIINPPQCAILATGRVAPRVVADEVGMMVRPMMTATLSADHRVVDGASAARFLQAVKRQLENTLL